MDQTPRLLCQEHADDVLISARLHFEHSTLLLGNKESAY